MPPQLDLVGLVVKDMKTSLDFYRALGLAIPEGAEKEDHVEHKVGGIRFAWDTIGVIKSFDPDWAPPSGGHQMGLGFLCTSPAEVDETYKRIMSLGYHGHKAPWDAFWGQRYATVHDPDGNGVDLFAPLAGG
ncbi:MAG: glyoxalase [Anaerolineaceae bacterium]|nr:glyoxalase [Anaerolineaceae bacterium]